MPQVEAYEIVKDVFLMDTQLLSIPHFCAVYLVKGEKLALMDAGDHTTADVVLAGIRQLGFQPQEISYIFCSHIHLDHSGAAGQLIKQMPKAQVVVHERGARHLADPSKLLESYGGLGGDPTLQALVKPVPPNQITSVKGGEIFSLGNGKTMQVVANPGHSPHSVSYLYSQHKGLFCGDAIGVYLEKENVLMPVAAPGYDNEQEMDSLKTLAGMPIDAIFFPHYGMVKNVAEVFRFAQKRWYDWGEFAIQILKAGNGTQLEEKLRNRARQELKAIENRKSLFDYLTGELITLSAMGYTAYYKRKASQG